MSRLQWCSHICKCSQKTSYVQVITDHIADHFAKLSLSAFPWHLSPNQYRSTAYFLPERFSCTHILH